MAGHEIDLFGFFASPIVGFSAIALVCTLVIGRLIDRLIPYSLQRHEGLVTVLTFVTILAICMRHAF